MEHSEIVRAIARDFDSEKSITFTSKYRGKWYQF